ncbi:MAG: S24 family peptidase [Sulfuricurvum sp.]|uniref:LexA family transcriptional regulator n=1 Tax=Sulfuricurvum sp. TaxID=2025608 RepID=UPI002732A10A|nr:S24 family peptidase [Sulfuricurvum sp.]MDP3290630.1 S24 family peptidase [Sulfuricurvum sp.]
MFNSEIAERLIAVRKALGYSDQRVFAPHIGVSWRTLQTYEQCTVKKMPLGYIETLNKQFNVSKDWIYTGKGSMFIEHGTIAQSITGNSNNQINGLNNTVSGDTTQKEHAYEALDQDDMVDIPFLHDVVASAGGGAVIPQDIDDTVIKFSASFLKDFLRVDRFNGIHLISATGNSMEPTIVPGELLMVNPYENEDCRTKDGAIYVIICTDSVFVKRVYRNPITKEMKLISDNKEVDDIIIKGDDLDGCKIVGRVVGHFDKL